MPKHLKFLLVIALQILIIIGLAAYKYVISSTGTEVILKIKPVDPRDLLRGDYVTFQYDISNVYQYSNEQNIKNGATVYVVLNESGSGNFINGGLRTVKPSSDTVFIKGVVQSGGREDNEQQNSKQGLSSHELHVVYGIEQFFIPENTGKNFSFAGKDVRAKVAIDENGNAVLKALNVDGKSWP